MKRAMGCRVRAFLSRHRPLVGAQSRRRPRRHPQTVRRREKDLHGSDSTRYWRRSRSIRSAVGAILMAATYPREVIEARASRRKIPVCTGDAALAAVKDKVGRGVTSSRDFPQVLAMMEASSIGTRRSATRCSPAARRRGLESSDARTGAGRGHDQSTPRDGSSQPPSAGAPDDATCDRIQTTNHDTITCRLRSQCGLRRGPTRQPALSTAGEPAGARWYLGSAVSALAWLRSAEPLRRLALVALGRWLGWAVGRLGPRQQRHTANRSATTSSQLKPHYYDMAAEPRSGPSPRRAYRTAAAATDTTAP